MGDGYRLARNLGHRVTRLAPALSAVECKGAFKPIKGVRAKARVQLLKKIKMSGERLQDGKGRVIKNESNDVIAEESGEVQFTADGLSGICIFDLSRFIKLYDSETLDDGFKKYSLRLHIELEGPGVLRGGHAQILVADVGKVHVRVVGAIPAADQGPFGCIGRQQMRSGGQPAA